MALNLTSYKNLAEECIHAGVFVECCGEHLDIDHIEPLEGRNTLDVLRSCILICMRCNKKYISRYD